MNLTNTTISVRSVNSKPVLSVVDGANHTDVPLDFHKPQSARQTLGPRAARNDVIAALIQDGLLRVAGFSNGHPIVVAVPQNRPTPPEAA